MRDRMKPRLTLADFEAFARAKSMEWGSKVKVPRGTARKLRRGDIVAFKNNREKQRSQQFSAGTHTVNWAGPQGKAPERNPHHHTVATVTDWGNGEFVVRQYAWSTDYPANIPSPRREEIAPPRYFRTYGAAKDLADDINRIAVPEHKPLRPALAR